MKKRYAIALITFLVSLFLATTVFASEHGDPVGGCPPRFELHHFMEHDGEHMHRHIGLDRDLNGDGFICMKLLPNDLHLHEDNSLPLP